MDGPYGCAHSNGGISIKKWLHESRGGRLGALRDVTDITLSTAREAGLEAFGARQTNIRRVEAGFHAARWNHEARHNELVLIPMQAGGRLLISGPHEQC